MHSKGERIRTTHVGSLPRPDNLLKAWQAPDASFDGVLNQAVRDVVRDQVALGIDVVSDGEFGKISFVSYAIERMGGFNIRGSKTINAEAGSREVLAFPNYYKAAAKKVLNPLPRPDAVCSGPVTYSDAGPLNRDLKNLREALGQTQTTDAFIASIAPADLAWVFANNYYRSDEEYLYALGEAMRAEYLAIVDAGFSVQIDSPALTTYYNWNPQGTIPECRKWAQLRVEVMNHALRGIPQDKIRFHFCYGINEGPRIHDMELKDIVDVLLRANVGAYSFEAANPRHEHEWRVWSEVKLPPGKILIPGVITNSSVLVEHPELVADRLVRFADAVGAENIVAGVDCGLASAADKADFPAEVCWAKLNSLVQGAAIASRRLASPKTALLRNAQ